ncbi:major facilitator superfamily domain-containing protein [Amylocystis lapponica]|nr:major facilitator superfamily domain-containing protein [Amylocystis lapponica]
MIAGQFSLVASQLLLMESKTFWMMCIGRLFEGISSSIILTVGLALICDVTPEKDIGGQYLAAYMLALDFNKSCDRNMGIVMVGFPLGALIGPPVGGALYDRWGYRAPFIFAIIFTVFDFAGRLLIIEPTVNAATTNTVSESSISLILQPAGAEKPDLELKDATTFTINACGTNGAAPKQASSTQEELSILGVVGRLLMSPRALTAFTVTFFCSFAFSAAEVAMPLHLQASSRLCCCRRNSWWGALTRQFSLAFFIVSYAIENFFIAASASPVTTELAAVTRGMDGVGYAHSFGAFNIIFGLGNTVHGSRRCSRRAGTHVCIRAGKTLADCRDMQIYAHVHTGWAVICYISVGVLGLSLLMTLVYMEDGFLLQRWRTSRHKGEDGRADLLSDAAVEAAPDSSA